MLQEVPAPPGCRTVVTQSCRKIPVEVQKKLPDEKCEEVPDIVCHLELEKYEVVLKNINTIPVDCQVSTTAKKRNLDWS